MSSWKRQCARANRAVFKWIVSLIIWAVWRMDQGHAADVTGDNLSVTGTADIGGDTLLFGTPTGISGAGLTLNYVDGSAGSVPDQLQFTAIRPTTSWLWLYTATGGVLKPQMWLDDTNTLTLYDRAATPAVGIQLIPTGTSIFKNSLTVNGTDNRMPNQTLHAAGSIITEGLGDARYVRSGSAGLIIGTAGGVSTLALPGGTATGVGSFAGMGASATGDYSSASGYGSTASGYSSTASGYRSVATGYAANAVGFGSNAEGVYSSALGFGSYSGGYFSSALGVYTHAYGSGATASGYNATADGDGSTAVGAFTEAAGQFQTVVGAYNLTQGDPSNWIAGDDLFQIGNGIDSDHLSNAFSVRKSGEASIFGNRLNFGLLGGQTPGAANSTGASVNYTDGAAGAVTFSAAKPNSTWAWQNNDSATVKPQMKLDGNNVLTIYDASGNPAIVLDPAHPIDGTTVLTQSVADGRYLVNGGWEGITVGQATIPWGGSGPAVSMPGGWASEPGTFATVGASATGFWATASGYGASASGWYSTATAYHSSASGTYSTATGHGAAASGGKSTASGYESTASGYESMASGYWSTASGDRSTASGYRTVAQGFAQHVVGNFNAPQGNAYTWILTDDLFQIGNGTDDTHRSNALTVKKNGDTTINGNTVITGQLTVTHIVPQGDLSMGSFTAGQ